MKQHSWHSLSCPPCAQCTDRRNTAIKSTARIVPWSPPHRATTTTSSQSVVLYEHRASSTSNWRPPKSTCTQWTVKTSVTHWMPAMHIIRTLCIRMSQSVVINALRAQTRICSVISMACSSL